MATSPKPCPRHVASGKGRVFDHDLATCPLPPPTSAARASAKASGAPAAWQGAVATSGEREAIEREEERRAKIAQAHAVTDRWAKVREEAKALGGPGLFGYLMLVEVRCVEAGLHPMDPQWLWHFEEFYASGKFLDVGRWGLRAAKSDSVCRAIVAETLMIERHLEPTVTGVCPVMSSKTSEANDRVDTIGPVLRACRLMDLGKKHVEELEPWQFQITGGGTQPHVIKLLDSQGHRVEFRINPANEASAAGFTGIAGFGDELDLWGKPGGANPAGKVVEILISRYTTQPEAKLHLMSATYDRRSYHAQLIEEGDSPLQRVARLGINGALKDYTDRLRLARSIGSTDPLLVAPGDPTSTDIPAWVSNPKAPIEDCYAKTKGDLRRMFALYGARPQFAVENDVDFADQCRLAAEINARLAVKFGSHKSTPQRQGQVMKVPGALPGDIRYAGPTHGPRRLSEGNWRTRKVM